MYLKWSQTQIILPFLLLSSALLPLTIQYIPRPYVGISWIIQNTKWYKKHSPGNGSTYLLLDCGFVCSWGSIQDLSLRGTEWYLPGGWEGVLLPCPAPCSAFSSFPTSSKKQKNNIWGHLSMAPLLSKAFSKCVLQLESKGRQGKLVFGGKERELQSSFWISARLSWRASWGCDMN